MGKKKNPPFLHREFEITDKSLQLWTELLNLLTPGPFWAGVTLCVCLWQKDLLERIRQLITFGTVMHPPSMVLALPARGCLWSQLV